MQTAIQPGSAYLGAGSNLGDRITHLRQGVEGLRRAGIRVRRVSPVFETEPVGVADQPWYLNLALEVDTGKITPRELLRICQGIETAHGRIRTYQGAPRTLDLDILLFGSQVVEEPGLQIPHPRMAQRRFVLEPLARIAPDVIHPVLRQTTLALLARCPDSSAVTLCGELNSVHEP